MLSSRALLRPTSRYLRCWQCSFATTAVHREGVPPPVAKFRTDMKEALKAKDNIRLNVLRGILTELTVLEKRSEAIQTDKQLYKLLSKRRKACKDAAAEFQGAGRDDLVGKENEQMDVLQGYMEEFPSLSTDEITAAIKDLISWMQSKGSNPRSDKKAMKYLFEKGGPFHDMIVDDAFVAETFKRLVSDLPPWDPSLRTEERHDRYDNWNKPNDRIRLADSP
ncbi:MAG: hypothetical protein Q9184_001096 [Pyrenodesmia sp. 2 TL-2023]